MEVQIEIKRKAFEKPLTEREIAYVKEQWSLIPWLDLNMESEFVFISLKSVHEKRREQFEDWLDGFVNGLECARLDKPIG